jgi:hypothetical protein
MSNILHGMQDIQTNEPILARFGEIYCILCSISRLPPSFWTNMLHFVQRKLGEQNMSDSGQSDRIRVSGGRGE